ncbi:ribonuclease H-like domain-containing protein [Sparassis latifolia]
MPKAKGPAFYAVSKGRVPGVYLTWDECEAQVVGYPGAKHKKFTTAAEAEAWVGLPASGSGSPSGSRSVPSVITHTAQVIKPHSKVDSKAALAPSSSSKVPSASDSAKSGKNRITAETLKDESLWDIVYSDGSCRGNGKAGSIAGIGVWWGRNDARNLAERCPGVQTNNRAELIAIVRVLETAPRNKHPLLIKTDSKYSISCFHDWLPNWIQNGFIGSKGEPVKNAPLIRYISTLIDERGLAGQKIHLQHVRGHTGEEGNEGADRLANRGALMPEVPERDWETLEEEVLKRSRGSERAALGAAAASATLEDLDLEAYAAGLLSPEELEREMMEEGL